jgi:hypothetical protein
MDAGNEGYGYVVPMPRLIPGHLGNVVYIDDQGVVRSMGKLVDDSYFKHLLEQSQERTEVKTIVEEHASLTVAFTTGCMEVKSLTEEEVAK